MQLQIESCHRLKYCFVFNYVYMTFDLVILVYLFRLLEVKCTRILNVIFGYKFLIIKVVGLLMVQYFLLPDIS